MSDFFSTEFADVSACQAAAIHHSKEYVTKPTPSAACAIKTLFGHWGVEQRCIKLFLLMLLRI
jgi:hypothetical protein